MNLIDPNADPREVRWEGIALHGNTPFDTFLMTEIEPGLYLAGCVGGLYLPDEIEYVVSLYPWEAYKPGTGHVETHKVWMYDAELENPEEVLEAARKVNEYREKGVTLIHCQAGLNRSGLVLAVALMLKGRTAEEAIAYLRERRSPAVLCNPHFVEWLSARPWEIAG